MTAPAVGSLVWVLRPATLAFDPAIVTANLDEPQPGVHRMSTVAFVGNDSNARLTPTQLTVDVHPDRTSAVAGQSPSGFEILTGSAT